MLHLPLPPLARLGRDVCPSLLSRFVRTVVGPGFLDTLLHGRMVFVAACVLLAGLPLWGWKKKKGWKWTLRTEAELLVGVYLWFYVGWGINYFRKDFFTRSSVEYVAYQDSTFQHFLADYTRRLNQAYTQSPFPSHEIIEKEVKQLFAQVPSRFGLSSPRSYQHPKQVMFNALYSGVGVLGYMGPFFAESQLNRELPPCNGRSPIPMNIPICWE